MRTAGPGVAASRAAVSARRAADAAARAAGVRIVTGHDHADLAEACRVIETVWQPDAEDPPVTRTMLRALSHAGNYLSQAYDGTAVVGICMGFFAAPLGTAMHSHIAGVTPQVAGRHVGYALKLDQRAWALEHGVTRIEWTFDPLVRRNAYFNVAKLAASPTEYLVDFYGAMNDGINVGQGSDRLLAVWDLLAPDVVEACAARRRRCDAAGLRSRGAQVVLDERTEAPVRTSAAPATDGVLLVRVPEDIETLRRRSPALAREWRLAVRETLGTLMCHGAAVVGFTRGGWYVLENTSA